MSMKYTTIHDDDMDEEVIFNKPMPKPSKGELIGNSKMGYYGNGVNSFLIKFIIINKLFVLYIYLLCYIHPTYHILYCMILRW